MASGGWQLRPPAIAHRRTRKIPVGFATLQLSQTHRLQAQSMYVLGLSRPIRGRRIRSRVQSSAFLALWKGSRRTSYTLKLQPRLRLGSRCHPRTPLPWSTPISTSRFPLYPLLTTTLTSQARPQWARLTLRSQITTIRERRTMILPRLLACSSHYSFIPLLILFPTRLLGMKSIPHCRPCSRLSLHFKFCRVQ